MAMKEHGEAFVEKDVGMENFKEEMLGSLMKFGTMAATMETTMMLTILEFKMDAVLTVGFSLAIHVLDKMERHLFATQLWSEQLSVAQPICTVGKQFRQQFAETVLLKHRPH